MNFSFRTFLIVLSLAFASVSNAQGIGNVQFGSTCEEATARIVETFGHPAHATSDEIVYNNKSFEGFRWNKVTFRFRNGQLCEARFYKDHKSKWMAKTELDSIAKNLSKKHAISLDYEEDGTRFYAGGQSPLGIGRLFTVFVAPRNGHWSDQLRFGPFKFKTNQL